MVFAPLAASPIHVRSDVRDVPPRAHQSQMAGHHIAYVALLYELLDSQVEGGAAPLHPCQCADALGPRQLGHLLGLSQACAQRPLP